MLETIEHETAPMPQWSVLWLHGLGADGHDFMPIIPELVASTLASFAFCVSACSGEADHD